MSGSRHGIGGELSPQDPAPDTRSVQFAQFGIVHLTGSMGTHGLEHVLNGDVFPMPPGLVNPPYTARPGGSTGRGVSRCGMDLSQPQHHHSIEFMSEGGQFSRIRNHLSRNQDARIRGSHTIPSETAMVLNSTGFPPAS